MNFDPRKAKALQPGQHIIFKEYSGLRLLASAKVRTWIYRYRSSVDSRLRQLVIGRWPSMSFPAAIVAWEKIKNQRDSGVDPVLEAKQAKLAEKELVKKSQAEKAESAYSVRTLCDEYLEGHVYRHRAKKGAKEITRMFDTMLSDFESLPSTSITRTMAFDLIQRYAGTSPVQAGKLRCELGAAWDYAMDAGRLPETAVNWWRLILRGKIRSKGKSVAGVKIGTAKRILSEGEVGELLAWLPNFPEQAADVLLLYLWTGARGSEIVGMTGAEISKEDGQYWWTIPKVRTKNARHERAADQRVPLFGRGLDIVLRRKGLYGESFLFPARFNNTHIEQHTILYQVHYRQPYCPTRPEVVRLRLTVSHWAPHDLRRTARTLLAKLGCPDSVGEVILGHMLPGVVGIYNRHHYDDEKQIWLCALSNHLESLVKSFEG